MWSFPVYTDLIPNYVRIFIGIDHEWSLRAICLIFILLPPMCRKKGKEKEADTRNRH